MSKYGDDKGVDKFSINAPSFCYYAENSPDGHMRSQANSSVTGFIPSLSTGYVDSDCLIPRKRATGMKFG
jgi:hypothetical protein